MEDNKITGLIPANSTAEWEKRYRVHRAIIEKWIVFGSPARQDTKRDSSNDPWTLVVLPITFVGLTKIFLELSRYFILKFAYTRLFALDFWVIICRNQLGCSQGQSSRSKLTHPSIL